MKQSVNYDDQSFDQTVSQSDIQEAFKKVEINSL